MADQKDPTKLLCPLKNNPEDGHCDGDACGIWIDYEDHPDGIPGCCGIAYGALAIAQLVQITKAAPKMMAMKLPPGILKIPGQG